MPNKQNRVNKHLFGDIIKKGVSYYTQNISLKIIKTEDNKPKFAVSVPKKEVKTAVKRNLLKRRVFSILGKTAVKTGSGFASVFFVKKGALSLPYQKLQDEIVFLLKKSKTLSSSPTTYNLPPTT